MKYFLHDSNAFSDEKVTLLYLKFGYESIGLFFTILEKLASQEQPINEIVLKSQLNIKKRLEKQLSFMYKIGILSLRNGDVFNENILKFGEKYQEKKENTRKRVSQWREKQADAKKVTCYELVRNTLKYSVGKLNIDKYKEKDIKEKFNFRKELLNLGIEKQIVEDWLKVRKTKNATNTETAFNSIKKQLELSNKPPNECIKIAAEKSWSGLKAEWIENIKPTNGKIFTLNDYDIPTDHHFGIDKKELTELCKSGHYKLKAS